jgi:tetratricopeptide (TPR) repeat protein
MKFSELQLKVFAAIILIVFGFLIYSNILQNSFHFDDGPSIAQNYSIRDIKNPQGIWDFWPTRFVTYLTFALNYHLHKFEVLGYHLTNIAIHIFAGLCVWWLSLLTFSTAGLKNSQITRHKNAIAFFTGMIFLAHPLQTQGVTYVVQRAVSLAALFYLASLCLYIKARLSESRGLIYLAASLICAVVAMFTKEMAISLPFAILLYEYCFLRGQKKPVGTYLMPVFLTVLIIPVTMYFTGSVNFGELRKTNEGPVGISPMHYLFTQARVMLTYLRLLVAPIKQNLDYDYPVYKSLNSLPVLFGFTAILGMISLAAGLFKKYRLPSFGIFFFLLAMLPESSLIPIKDVIFEHRLYLPMAGFSIFLVSGIYYILGQKRRDIMALVLSILAVGCGVLTFTRNYIWHDEFSLWNDVIRKSSHKSRPYHNRALAYQNIKGYGVAIEDYSKAIRLDPQFTEAYINRGILYAKLGNFEQATADYRQAIKLKPDSAFAYNNLANASAMEGKLDEAINYFDQAIKLDPKFSEAYSNRGLAYSKKGQIKQALEDFDKSILLNPYEGTLYYPRAYIYMQEKDFDKAWADAHKAQSLGFVFDEKFIQELQKASRAYR